MTTVKFNQNVLRDGHQSLAATRMPTSAMLPVCGELDACGFNALETWGGATIDACVRYLAEDPFDRLGKLTAAAPKTPHMMLLRGQNIVQYTAFPDDVVQAFVACTAARGMTIFRIFDALNDLKNTEVAVKAVLKAGKHPQGAISYTISPVHTVDRFVANAREFHRQGCQSICIKDMAGLLAPGMARELVTKIKAAVPLPLVLHSHNTACLAVPSYLAAIDAGVDIVDVSIAPFANGTGQPDQALMLALLEGNPRAPKYDMAAYYRLREHFTKVYADLSAFTSPANERTDLDILRFQVPGGMLSNFRNQLKEQNMAERLPEVLDEIPRVREALGWIPLVTPTSQIVGTQAMLNVRFGRWKNLSQQAAEVALGKYGQTPGTVDPEVKALAISKFGPPVEGRAADHLKPRMESLKAELKSKGLRADDEAAVLYAMFPSQTEAILRGTAQPEKPPAKPAAAAAPAKPKASGERTFDFTVDGVRHQAVVAEVN